MPARPHTASPESIAAPDALPVATRRAAVLTPEMIEQFKQQLVASGFPDRLYRADICGQTVVFRPLLLGDYNLIQQFIRANENTARQDEIDQKVCEAALVYPQEILAPARWECQPAGLQSTLAKEVLARSGFIVPEVDQTGFLAIEPLTTIEPGRKPTEGEVAQLKAKYNWSLERVEIGGQFYVIRPLNRQEWRQLSQSGQESDLDLLTAERACVWASEYPEPARFGERIAGVSRTLSERVMQISGFNQSAAIEAL